MVGNLAMEEKMNWHRVEDELPPEGVHVLCWDDRPEELAFIAKYDGRNKWFYSEEFDNLYASHWAYIIGPDAASLEEGMTVTDSDGTIFALKLGTVSL
jgi:hypothetical protein